MHVHTESRGILQNKVRVLHCVQQPGLYGNEALNSITCGSQSQTDVTAYDQLPGLLTTRLLSAEVKFFKYHLGSRRCSIQNAEFITYGI